MAALTLVLCLTLDQPPQGPSEIGITKDFTGFWALAVWQIDLHAGGILVKFLRGRQSGSQRITDGKTVLRQIDGFRKHLGKIHGAPAIEQDVPRVDTARHRARQKRIVYR